MTKQDKSTLSDTLSKILHQAGSNDNAFDGLLSKLKALGLDLRDLRITVGEASEVERLRSELDQYRRMGPQKWAEFENLGRIKGYETVTAMAEAIGKEVAFVKSCKQNGAIPHTYYYAMSVASDLRQARVVARTSQAAARAAARPAIGEPSQEAFEAFCREVTTSIRNGATVGVAREICKRASIPGNFSGALAARFREGHPEHRSFFPAKGKKASRAAASASLPFKMNGETGHP